MSMPASEKMALVHGWAFGPRVWQPLCDQAAMTAGAVTWRLPGYPGGGDEPVLDVDAGLPANGGRVAVGWSLGGMMLAAAAARRPNAIRALVLVAANARFIADATWPDAVAPSEFDALVAGLRDDRDATLRRFATLCARGQAARQTLRSLLDCFEQQAPPTTEVLLDGLSRLQSMDLRNDIAALNMPVLLILGDADPLVPVAAAAAMRRINPNIEVCIIHGAGHAPFLSHGADFLRAIDAFTR
jgi:pimeloyl-[acyl-carrier protein] methyl ester esterase